MKDLRIVFMGTPDFAVTILQKLLEEKLNVVGVITAPDKPAGRGRKIHESAVKKFALQHELHLLQPTNLKSEDFISELQYLKADLQIVVAFRMLPKVVWNMPQYGTFNLHASLLPEYRGAAPIHWAIINGETQTGVTTFFIDDKIDTGAIILSKETEITKDDTVGTLHDKLMFLGADLVFETVKAIAENAVKTTPQPEKEEKPAPKLTPENTRINWNKDLHTIYNKIRGLNPFPSAWTNLEQNDTRVKLQLFDVEKQFTTHNLPNGKIIANKKELKIAVKDGYLIINELKLAGKRKMDAKSLLNGFNFSEGAKVR